MRAYAVWFTWELGLKAADPCDAMSFCSMDMSVSGAMVRRFMFSSSWMRAWVLVV